MSEAILVMGTWLCGIHFGAKASRMKPKSEAQDRAQTRRAIYQRQRQAAADALRALQALQRPDPEPECSSGHSS